MEKSINKENLLFLQVNSLAGLFQLSNELFKREKEIEIIDFFPMEAQGLLVVKGQLHEIWKDIQENKLSLAVGGFFELVKFAFVQKYNEKLLAAYLSLENANIKENLVILESSFVGDLFVWGSEFLKWGFEVVDFRAMRSAQGFSYLILTSSDINVEAEIFIEKLLFDKKQVTKIKDLSYEFKEHFLNH